MNRKVLLDPGHGGRDPGAVANGMRECDLNLKIAMYCRAELAKYQCEIFMTRTSDVTVSNEARAAMGTGKDIYFSIHNNYYSKATSANGFESFVFSGDVFDTTLRYREVIHDTIMMYMSTLNIRDRGKKRANFWMLREPKCPCVLVEYMFMTNPREAELLRSEAVLRELGRRSALGIVSALGLKLKESELHKAVIVVPRVLNFRTGPSTNYQVITGLIKGTILDVISKSGQWLQVKTSEGQIGWVHGDYTEEYIKTKLVRVTARVLNFREGAGTNHTIITGIPFNTVLTVKGTQGEWFKVEYQGKEGWIHGFYTEESTGQIFKSETVLEYLIEKNWRLTSDFGWRIHPITGRRTFHNGIDFGVPNRSKPYEPIPTPYSCVVTQRRFITSRGNTIVARIDGTNILQLFQHLQNFRCNVGDRLKEGDIVGLCGSTGDSTAVHLHYELRVDNGTIIGSPVWGDPKDFRLTNASVRLGTNLGVVQNVATASYNSEHIAIEALNELLDMDLEAELVVSKNGRFTVVANKYYDKNVADNLADGLRQEGYKKTAVIVSDK